MEKLFADVAALAAPGSHFHFDFLHLDVLEGRAAAVGYENTAKASDGGLICAQPLPVETIDMPTPGQHVCSCGICMLSSTAATATEPCQRSTGFASRWPERHRLTEVSKILYIW